jgi:hypothetical protein
VFKSLISGRVPGNSPRCLHLTARQFNAARIPRQGKIEAIRQLLPVQVANLQTRMGKAKMVEP